MIDKFDAAINSLLNIYNHNPKLKDDCSIIKKAINIAKLQNNYFKLFKELKSMEKYDIRSINIYKKNQLHNRLLETELKIDNLLVEK